MKIDRLLPHPATVVESLSLPPDALRGVRACFINAPIREAALPNVAPVGIALLAARLREYGAEPTIVDLNAYRVRDDEAQRRGLAIGRFLTVSEVEVLLTEHFNHFGDQDLVALSGIITTLRWQEIIAALVRRLQPNALIVSGNGLATEFREGLFNWIPQLDGVAHSEGDDVIIKIAYDAGQIKKAGVKAALGSGALDPYLIGEVNGRPRLLYHGDRPRDLNALPLPAWDLLECDVRGNKILEEYICNPVWGAGTNNSSSAPFSMARSMTTVSSRGCPFGREFCFRGAQGERFYGIRSAYHLVNEMEWLITKYDVDFIGMTDDNFMVDTKRIAALREVMRPLIEKYSLRWGTHGRLDEAADIRPGSKERPAMCRVEMMAEAGRVYIGFGAESADPTVLHRMGKGGFILTNGLVQIGRYEFPLSMVEGVRATMRAGIHGNCTWIMGYPGETLDALKRSIAFILWQQEAIGKEGVVNRRLFTATAYPGTVMFRDNEVQAALKSAFRISFDEAGNPISDGQLRYYTLELDDATKVLRDQNSNPLNFSAMPTNVFMRARDYIDDGDLEAVMRM